MRTIARELVLLQIAFEAETTESLGGEVQVLSIDDHALSYATGQTTVLPGCDYSNYGLTVTFDEDTDEFTLDTAIDEVMPLSWKKIGPMQYKCCSDSAYGSVKETIRALKQDNGLATLWKAYYDREKMLDNKVSCTGSRINHLEAKLSLLRAAREEYTICYNTLTAGVAPEIKTMIDRRLSIDGPIIDTGKIEHKLTRQIDILQADIARWEAEALGLQEHIEDSRVRSATFTDFLTGINARIEMHTMQLNAAAQKYREVAPVLDTTPNETARQAIYDFLYSLQSSINNHNATLAALAEEHASISSFLSTSQMQQAYSVQMIGQLRESSAQAAQNIAVYTRTREQAREHLGALLRQRNSLDISLAEFQDEMIFLCERHAAVTLCNEKERALETAKILRCSAQEESKLCDKMQRIIKLQLSELIAGLRHRIDATADLISIPMTTLQLALPPRPLMPTLPRPPMVAFAPAIIGPTFFAPPPPPQGPMFPRPEFQGNGPHPGDTLR